jgi:hypothetical protein
MIDGRKLRRCLQLLIISGDLGTPLAPCMIYLQGGVSLKLSLDLRSPRGVEGRDVT